jgi:hypothetical protein
MKLKLTIISALFFFTFSNLSAQESFVDGYYINQKNDTIKGLILDYDWEINPKTVVFKDKSNQQEIFNATVIRGFGLFKKDEHFVGRSITLSKIATEINEGESPISEKIPVSYFLRVLVNTPLVNLYSLSPEEDDRIRYYLEKDGRLTELENYQYYLNQSTRTYIKKVEHYKNQLKGAFADCNEFVLGEVDYIENDLKKKVINYCELKTGKKYIAKTNKPVTYLTVFGDFVPEKPSFFLAGAGVRVFLPRNFGRNFIDAELRPLGSINRRGIRPTFEIISGRMAGSGKTKMLFGIGVGGVNLNIIPVAGVSFNNFISLEARYNISIFKADYDNVTFFGLRLRANTFKFGTKQK